MKRLIAALVVLVAGVAVGFSLARYTQSPTEIELFARGDGKVIVNLIKGKIKIDNPPWKDAPVTCPHYDSDLQPKCGKERMAAQILSNIGVGDSYGPTPPPYCPHQLCEVKHAR